MASLLAAPACGQGGIKSDVNPDGSGGEDYGCIVGEQNCECAMDGFCDPSLACEDEICMEGGDSLESSGLPQETGDETVGDGDGDGTGSETGGDGDGDGDGDSTTTGDGDGDGDGDTTGDGDGDTTGDGDGDGDTTGDGDGDTTGDGDTGTT